VTLLEAVVAARRTGAIPPDMGSREAVEAQALQLNGNRTNFALRRPVAPATATTDFEETLRVRLREGASRVCRRGVAPGRSLGGARLGLRAPSGGHESICRPGAVAVAAASTSLATGRFSNRLPLTRGR
jgi:hypothetical protein